MFRKQIEKIVLSQTRDKMVVYFTDQTHQEVDLRAVGFRNDQEIIQWVESWTLYDGSQEKIAA